MYMPARLWQHTCTCHVVIEPLRNRDSADAHLIMIMIPLKFYIVLSGNPTNTIYSPWYLSHTAFWKVYDYPVLRPLGKSHDPPSLYKPLIQTERRANLAALIFRIGFWGPPYYDNN